MYESHDTPLEFCWYHDSFSRNQQLALYKEIHIYYAFGDVYSLILQVFLSLVLIKLCFDKNGCHFDDVGKIGYSKPFLNKRIWK